MFIFLSIILATYTIELELRESNLYKTRYDFKMCAYKLDLPKDYKRLRGICDLFSVKYQTSVCAKFLFITGFSIDSKLVFTEKGTFVNVYCEYPLPSTVLEYDDIYYFEISVSFYPNDVFYIFFDINELKRHRTRKYKLHKINEKARIGNEYRKVLEYNKYGPVEKYVDTYENIIRRRYVCDILRRVLYTIYRWLVYLFYGFWSKNRIQDDGDKPTMENEQQAASKSEPPV